MAYKAASHQRATKVFWLHFEELSICMKMESVMYPLFVHYFHFHPAATHIVMATSSRQLLKKIHSPLSRASLWATIKWLHAPRPVYVSTALSLFLGPDGQRPRPMSLPKQWRWLTGIYDRGVKYLKPSWAMHMLFSNWDHWQGGILITTSSCTQSVSDGLTGWPVTILTRGP